MEMMAPVIQSQAAQLQMADKQITAMAEQLRKLHISHQIQKRQHVLDMRLMKDIVEELRANPPAAG